MRRFRALLVLCGLFAVDAAWGRRCAAQFLSLSPNDTIVRVSAAGNVVIPIAPDRAVVYAAVAGRDSTGPGALADAVAIRDRALAALARLGLRGEQMVPWGFALGRDEGPGARPARAEASAAMTARWGIRVVVDRMDRLDAVVGALAGAGIERTAYVSFEATRPTEARRIATEQAVAEARRNAEAMARAAGGRLGELLSLNNLSDAAFGGMDETRFRLSQGYNPGATLNPSDTSVRAVVHASWRFLRN